MKKGIMVVGFLLGFILGMFIVKANAETWIDDYGYYENNNEISAKDRIMNDVNNVFDFEKSSNAGGERIEKGRYYIETKYKGGYNGIDADYIYLDEIIGKDGMDGKDGVNGQDGYTPIKGIDYFDGINGEDGRDGIDGVNGIDGKNGTDGEQGIKGDTGEQGIAGEDGKNGSDGKNGEKGDKGKEGKKGKQGKQGIQGMQGKGLEDRIELIGEIRVFDTRKWTGFVYGGRDINNDVNIVGAKLQFKFGTSYEERRLNELEKKINKLQEEQEMNSIKVVPYGNTGLQIKTNF